ncbi:MAG: 2-oxopent-4-enoate hydratase, partial [Thauera sp.]|nr:2-oxopent-4-enoate hydratase [Thauera sp.]
MDQKTIEALGDSLYDALVARTPIAPLSAAHPDMTIEDAYAVQKRMIDRRVQDGEVIVGKKIGVTSRAVMNMLGVYQPDFGYMMDRMIVNEGESIAMSTLIQPKAEGEIAFL